jgi:hypothetical protein
MAEGCALTAQEFLRKRRSEHGRCWGRPCFFSHAGTVPLCASNFGGHLAVRLRRQLEAAAAAVVLGAGTVRCPSFHSRAFIVSGQDDSDAQDQLTTSLSAAAAAAAVPLATYSPCSCPSTSPSLVDSGADLCRCQVENTPLSVCRFPAGTSSPRRRARYDERELGVGLYPTCCRTLRFGPNEPNLSPAYRFALVGLCSHSCCPCLTVDLVETR